MKKLQLKPQKINEKIIRILEKKGLIKTLLPQKNFYNLKKNTDKVETIYSTSPQFGSHKLICVGKNITKIVLNTHSDNEDFLIINPTKYKFKPLYLIIGLHHYKVIEEKFRKDTITNEDILALELEYNNPILSFFTMLKGTPHCEVTSHNHNGKAPVFFVTEPTNLKMYILNTYNYQISL